MEEHVEDGTKFTLPGQELACTLCHTYRMRLQDAILEAEGGAS